MHESDHWYASRAVGANDAAKSTLQIGDIEGDGDRKAEIYGGILPSDQKPIWFLQAPKLMKHSPPLRGPGARRRFADREGRRVSGHHQRQRRIQEPFQP